MISNRSNFVRASLLLFSIFILTTACSEKKQIKGREFVPRDVMVDLMTDMHLLDGITNDVKYYRKYDPNDSIDLYGSLFEKYEVDREKFYSTMAEYTKYPTLLDEVYDEVLMKLNMMQDEMDKEREEEKAKLEEAVKPKLNTEKIERNRKRATPDS